MSQGVISALAVGVCGFCTLQPVGSGDRGALLRRLLFCHVLILFRIFFRLNSCLVHLFRCHVIDRTTLMEKVEERTAELHEGDLMEQFRISMSQNGQWFGLIFFCKGWVMEP